MRIALTDTITCRRSAGQLLSDAAPAPRRRRPRGLALAGTVALAGCAAGFLGPANAIAGNASPNRLDSGQRMMAGDHLESGNGQFRLAMQGDGNLVLYNQGANLWNSHTSGTGVRVEMQRDGNLVVRSSTNSPLWNSGTAHNPGSDLRLRDDGNLSLQAADGTGLWSTGTANPPARVYRPSWWRGMCERTAHPGSTVGPSWDGLTACGPGQYDWPETGPGSPLPGNYEWECVELVERWLYQEFNLPQVVTVPEDPGKPTDGWLVVKHYWDYIKDHPKRHYPLTKMTPTSPSPAIHTGDVISYGNSKPGHTAIVTSARITPTGNGTITTLNQNLGNGLGGPLLLTRTVSHWNFSVYGMPATGWLHWTGAASADDSWQQCGNSNDPTHPWGQLRALGIACADARHVADAWPNQHVPLGFKCVAGPPSNTEGQRIDCARTANGTTDRASFAYGT